MLQGDSHHEGSKFWFASCSIFKLATNLCTRWCSFYSKLTPLNFHKVLLHSPECKMPPWRAPPLKNKMSNKKATAINYTHLTHTSCRIIHTTTSYTHCLLSSHSVPPSPSHSPLTSHNTPLSVPSTTLNIQHFLITSTVTSGKMLYRAVAIRTD
jgi:hypothetical protein